VYIYKKKKKKNKGEKMHQLKYFWIIGSLLYVMSWIWPNITYLVSKPSRFIVIQV
jgi:hypothetical protein